MYDVSTLRRGDRVYRYAAWAGTSFTATGRIDEADIIVGTVVRVNATTVTVDVDNGPRLRWPHVDVVGNCNAWEA